MLRLVLAVLASAALSVGAAGAQGATTSGKRTALTPLEATNELLAIPWRGLAVQRERDNERGMLATLADRTLVSKSGGPDRLRWSFSLKVRDGRADYDFASPPGFTSISPTQIGFAMPRTGGWRIAFGGRLKGNAKVKSYGQTLVSWSPSFQFGLDIRDIRIRTTMDMTAGANGMPRLTRVEASPSLTLRGNGSLPFSIPISLSSRVEDGKINLSGDFASVGFSLPGALSATLTGTLTLTLQRGPDAALEVEDRIDFRANTMFLYATVTGSLKVSIPRVGSKTMALNSLVGYGLLPSFPEVDELFRMAEGEIPQQWGRDARSAARPPQSSFDYAATALALEQGIAADHLPHGAVLNRNCDGFDAAHNCLNPVYSAEVDSAIWSGHYLAAEALRYAATSTPEALERVRTVLGGIERLFEVTGDAAVSGGKRVAVQRGRVTGRTGRTILSRTAWPYPAAGTPLPVGGGQSFAEGPLQGRKCYYENPEGGWRAGSTIYETFADVPADVAASARPVGVIWRGWGCAENHPVSRDQIVGVFLGLAFAHEFVQVQDVKNRARAMAEGLLDDLLANGWNVRLPPDNRIAETSSFFGILPMQLAFLRIGATMNPGKYEARYRELAPAAEHTWVPVWFGGFDPIWQYYGFNLSHAAFTPALLLENDPTVRAGYQRAADMLWGNVKHHQNAYFELLRILMQPPGQRTAMAAQPGGSNPGISAAEEIRWILADWIARWDKVRTSTNMPRYAIGDPQVQVDLYPNGVARFNELDGGRPLLSVYTLPPRGRRGRDLDFMWQRHPFRAAFNQSSDSPECAQTPPTPTSVAQCGARNRVAPGVDYLLAYWLAAYLGIVPTPNASTTVPPPPAPAEPTETRVRLSAGPVTFDPPRPRAGARLTVRMTVTRGDTGALPGEGQVACSARAGRTPMAPVSRTLVQGVASCVFAIPQNASGELVRGTIEVRTAGASISRDFSVRVR